MTEPGPIGQTLDKLGITATLEPGALISGAIVLLKVISPEGAEQLSLSRTQGLGWIEGAGMIHAAHLMEDASVIGRRVDGC